MTARFLTLILCSSYILSPQGVAFGEQSEIEHFESKIRPVLIKYCYECHSMESKAVKGGLLLDSREGLLTGGDSGPAIVPGKVEESLLIESLKFESYEMPPSGKLPEHVIKDFEVWIQQGAIDPRKSDQKLVREGIDWEQARQFWSYQPLSPHKPGQLSLTEQIDQALDQELEKEGVTPNPAAAPEVRLRRLFYDLTGLPPSPEQIMEFIADPSPARWEATVDQLLASRQYAERWGRHWLDITRYADSNGGDFNATFKDAWRYRNYVIDAFNHDKPLNQFLVEQIAGDLLPAENDQQRAEQLIATGYLMVGPKMLSERDKEKLEFDVVDEQIDSIGKAFLGLSLGCARCHDHKFDPIPTADYYALAGIFRSTQVLDGESQQYVSDWVRRELPTSPEHRQEVETYNQQVDNLTKAIRELEKQSKAQEKELADLEAARGAITIDNKKAKLVGNWTSSTFFRTFVGEDYIHDNKEKKSVKTATFEIEVAEAGKYEVLFGYHGTGGRDDHVPVTFHHRGESKTTYVDQTVTPPIREQFISLGEHELKPGEKSQVVISNEGTTGYVIVDAVQLIPVGKTVNFAADQEALAALQTKRDETKKKLEGEKKELDQLKKAAPKPIPQAFAVREREQCSDCEILIRGDHENKGAQVRRGTLQIISGERSVFENVTGSGRLEFAQWLTTDASALVSRVYVNRIWHHVYGAGLVRSVDNFGSLGNPPSHPELLELLSSSLIEQNWSTKKLIRAMVLTQAYQRSTSLQESSYEKDPENRLLWRAHRRSLTSEEIQDSLARLEDKLDLKPGESTVAHLGNLVVDNSSDSRNADKAEYYQSLRAVYHPVLRSQLSDLAYLFDFANPEMVVGRRPPTNVPAQALYLMNHRAPREAAAALVDQIFARHGVGSFSGINDLYLSIFNRLPTTQDDELARDFFENNLAGSTDEARIRTVWVNYVQAMLASTEFRYLD